MGKTKNNLKCALFFFVISLVFFIHLLFLFNTYNENNSSNNYFEEKYIYDKYSEKGANDSQSNTLIHSNYLKISKNHSFEPNGSETSNSTNNNTHEMNDEQETDNNNDFNEIKEENSQIINSTDAENNDIDVENNDNDSNTSNINGENGNQEMSKENEDEYVIGEENHEVSVINVTSINVDTQKLELYVGDKKCIKVIINPQNATNKDLEWTSSNDNVVSVLNGNVEAKNPGTAVITVKSKDSNHSSECKVTVSYKPILVETDIHIEKKCRFGNSGTYCTKRILASVLPSGGNGNYIYYYLKLYRNNINIQDSTNSTVGTNLYANGDFFLMYEVRDSAGNIKKGKSNIITID